MRPPFAARRLPSASARPLGLGLGRGLVPACARALAPPSAQAHAQAHAHATRPLTVIPQQRAATRRSHLPAAAAPRRGTTRALSSSAASLCPSDPSQQPQQQQPPLWERSVVPDKRGRDETETETEMDALFVKELQPHGWGYGTAPATQSQGGGGEGIRTLQNTYAFKSYGGAVRFVERVAAQAHAEKHHPRIVLEYGRVQVQWWSHSSKGLTLNDYIMAAKTERIAEEAEGRRTGRGGTNPEAGA